ncbi:MAG: rubrerythrin family protein [Ruminococcus sp.]|nr:rubrerythrin family protein [Ruminococcus sp.]
MQTNFNESRTKLNLMRAFAGESQSRMRYYLAAVTAQQQFMVGIERMFRFTAEQEEHHAKVFFELLKDAAGEEIPIKADFPADVYTDLQQLLDAAAKGEDKEFSEIYPEFARVAAEEGFTDIGEKFRMIAEIEDKHKHRFQYYADLMRKDMLFRSDDTEEKWMCLNCGHIHTGSEPPQQCPVCAVKQGFYVREPEAPFTSCNIMKA